MGRYKKYLHRYDKYFEKLPRPLARLLRDAHFSVLDMKDRLGAKADDLTPPRALQFMVGGGDFRAIGDSFFRHFVNVGDLHPTDAVLDIGCGTGRMAIPLMKYMSPSGKYLGFDISEKAIIWCQRNITRRNPNFAFHYANIRNAEYNPHGSTSAVDYRFPCDDNKVDFAYATSVFTHMRRSEVMHYLAELRRTLKPSGRAMLSFFILDEENNRLMRNGCSVFNFAHVLEDCCTIDPKTPERAIAYSVEDVNSMVSNAGLHIRHPILYGSWSGRTSMLDSQDVVLVSQMHPEK
jgi:ubiquinone/menaquinone biosynthesis C-methylase UbiE